MLYCIYSTYVFICFCLSAYMFYLSEHISVLSVCTHFCFVCLYTYLFYLSVICLYPFLCYLSVPISVSQKFGDRLAAAWLLVALRSCSLFKSIWTSPPPSSPLPHPRSPPSPFFLPPTPFPPTSPPSLGLESQEMAGDSDGEEMAKIYKKPSFIWDSCQQGGGGQGKKYLYVTERNRHYTFYSNNDHCQSLDNQCVVTQLQLGWSQNSHFKISRNTKFWQNYC